MRARIARSAPSIWYLAVVAMAAWTVNATSAHEGANACAEKEVLLATLVEAHGPVPNRASEILAANGGALLRAGEACAGGDAIEAVALLDRLIAELSKPTTQVTAGR
jgi:hypothetical protein